MLGIMQMNLEYFPIDTQVLVDNISCFISSEAMLINKHHRDF